MPADPFLAAREEPERATRLLARYDETFNGIRLREYDGSHLTLPGASDAIQLDPHQKNFVWGVLQDGNALAAHVVGAGKTFAMVAAGMELRRIGLARKVCHVVPDHMLEQYSRELLQLYPSAHILVASSEDFARSPSTTDSQGHFSFRALPRAAITWNSPGGVHPRPQR